MQKTVTSDQIIFDEHIIVAKRKTPFDCAWNKFSLDAILTPVHSPVGLDESGESFVSIIDSNDDLVDLSAMQLSMTMGGVKPSDAIKHDCMWTGQCNEHPQAKRYNINCHATTRRTIQPTSSRSLLKPQDFNYTCNAAIKISPNNSFADDGFIELWAHQIRPETPKSLTGDEAFDEKNLKELIDFIQNDKDNAMDIIEKLESENDYTLSSSGEDMSDDCAFDPAKILNCMKFEVDDESNSINSDMSDCYFGYDIKTERGDNTTAITNSVILTTTENDHSYYATREHAGRFNNFGVDTPSDSGKDILERVALYQKYTQSPSEYPHIKEEDLLCNISVNASVVIPRTNSDYRVSYYDADGTMSLVPIYGQLPKAEIESEIDFLSTYNEYDSNTESDTSDDENAMEVEIENKYATSSVFMTPPQDECVSYEISPPTVYSTGMTVSKKQIAQKSIAQKQIAQKPIAQKSIAQKQIAQRPIAQKQIAQKPIAQKQIAQKLIAQKPSTTRKNAKQTPAPKRTYIRTATRRITKKASVALTKPSTSQVDMPSCSYQKMSQTSEEEEIDVVSLNPTHIPQQQLRTAVKTSPFMPTNPTIKERQKLQNKVATAISATKPAPIAVKTYNGRYITAAKALVKQELVEDEDDDDEDDYLLEDEFEDEEEVEEEEVEEEEGEEEEYVVCKRGRNKRQPLRNKTNIQGRNNAQPQPSCSNGRGRKRAATTQRGPQKGAKRGRGARGRRKREDMDSQDEDEKRSLHNVMERQRRIELRRQFDDLRLTIPCLVDKDRAAKVLILREAKAMCDHLTVENERLEDQEDSLRRQQEQLETRLKSLRRWVYKNKVQLILNNINVDKLLQQ